MESLVEKRTYSWRPHQKKREPTTWARPRFISEEDPEGTAIMDAVVTTSARTAREYQAQGRAGSRVTVQIWKDVSSTAVITDKPTSL